MKNGILIIGGFSNNNGPTKCSGLDVCQHDADSIITLFDSDFNHLKSFEQKHITPSGSEQNFIWNILKRN